MIEDGYKTQLQKEHGLHETSLRPSNWGSTGANYAGKEFADRINSKYTYAKTALDFGSGKGSMKAYLAVHCPQLTVTEYDPGIPGKDVLPDEMFDIVLSTDVLEHVEPHKIDDVIRELDKRTRFVALHDIACYPTGKTFGEGPYKHKDLHLIVEPPPWWREKFAEVSYLTEHEYRHWSMASARVGNLDRCLLVMERVN